MWSPNELLKTEKQRDILSYITLQFFPFKKVPLEHYPLADGLIFGAAGGIRTHVPVTRQLDFESSSLWPLRYVSILLQ